MSVQRQLIILMCSIFVSVFYYSRFLAPLAGRQETVKATLELASKVIQRGVSMLEHEILVGQDNRLNEKLVVLKIGDSINEETSYVLLELRESRSSRKVTVNPADHHRPSGKSSSRQQQRPPLHHQQSGRNQQHQSSRNSDYRGGSKSSNTRDAHNESVYLEAIIRKKGSPEVLKLIDMLCREHLLDYSQCKSSRKPDASEKNDEAHLKTPSSQTTRERVVEGGKFPSDECTNHIDSGGSIAEGECTNIGVQV